MSLEIVRPKPAGAPRVAVFDFDGTLSLIRGGWTELMVDMMTDGLRPLHGSTESTDQLRRHVLDFVLALNGQPTIFQMQRYADEITARGGRAEPAANYHAEYLERLGVRINQRKTAIAAGTTPADDLLVPGARGLLTELQQRGVTLILASGTEVHWVREEAAVLGIDDFFGGRIYGPESANPHAFSKRQVMADAIQTLGIDPPALVSLGDGVAEMAAAAELGSIAVGVASDELHRSGRPEAWKRDRLIAAGADVVIPDFQQTTALCAWLFDGRTAGL